MIPRLRCTAALRRCPEPRPRSTGGGGSDRDPFGQIPVYSFQMVLSHSRGPFCRYTTSMDLATFWDCHTRAFARFGGVPAEVLYDRTKTVVRRHVGRNPAGAASPGG